MAVFAWYENTVHAGILGEKNTALTGKKKTSQPTKLSQPNTAFG